MANTAIGYRSRCNKIEEDYILKVLLVHNAYGTFSGEEASVKNISGLLGHYGHDVIHYFRSSEEISQMPFGKVKAFFSGIYNLSNCFRHFIMFIIFFLLYHHRF